MLDGSRDASAETVERMLAGMVHRGPDDAGIMADGPLAMGMRRLSIIDLAGGHQPIASEDGMVSVVFNGEIYNYVELREDLQQRGHRFRTQSDTETIVHLYEEKGPRCVEDLNGMFALAVWDARRRRLLLARDRVGIKPLHVCTTGGTLRFASELPALLQDASVPRELDVEALDDYLTFFYIPGRRSIYRSVRKLLPGHRMICEGGTVRTERYWRPAFAPRGGRPTERIEAYAEAFREQLRRSVRLQMRSDVPVGVFLSGGLDSGSLVATAAEMASGRLQTFTIGFDSPSYDERRYARATAERYGTEHHEFVIGPDDLRRSGELLSHFGEPFGPFTIAQAWAISRWSRDRVKVALAGDGGDELFGGYQTYVATRAARAYLALPEWVRRHVVRRAVGAMPVSEKLMSLDFMAREFVRGAEMFARGGNMAWKVIFSDEEKRRLLTGDFLGRLGGRDPFEHVRELVALAGDRASDLQRSTWCDLAMFLPDSILTQTDRMSMAVSQEVRVPLLDHEMVEFAAGVPDRYKCRGRRTKILVREATRRMLPDAVVNKPKTGFTTPVPVWLRGPLRDYVRDVLAPAAVGATGILRPAEVTRLVEEHESGRADHARRIWSLVSFMLWHARQGGTGRTGGRA